MKWNPIVALAAMTARTRYEPSETYRQLADHAIGKVHMPKSWDHRPKPIQTYAPCSYPIESALESLKRKAEAAAATAACARERPKIRLEM